MDSPSSEKNPERFCVKLPEESGGFGFVRYRSLYAINLPTGRMSSLQGRDWGAFGRQGERGSGKEVRARELDTNKGGTREQGWECQGREVMCGVNSGKNCLLVITK